MTSDADNRKRWWALMVLCLGVLMIVLDPIRPAPRAVRSLAM
jgi:hypothetical protein